VRCWWADPGDAARELVVATARRVGVGPADPRVLGILALAGPVDSGALVAEVTGRAVRAAPTSSQAPDEARQLGFAAHTTGDFERSLELLGQATPGFRHQGRLGLLAQVLTVRAWDAIHLGWFDDASRDADEGGRLALETGQPVWTAGSQIAQSLLAAVRGDYPLAEALGAQAERAILPLRLSNLLAVLQLARGLAALSAGTYADAYDHLRRMFDPRDVAFNQIESYAAVGYLAEAAMHADRRAEARDLMTEIEALGRHTPAPLLHVGLGYARAALADDGDAEDLYAAALGTASAWPFDGARLRLAYGAWLRRRRRVAESRDPLRAARDAFDRLGATPWTDRARRELRASGERSLEQPIARPEALSPQELQIARMAADGLSNREIGERLFVSHRTVGSHLYRIFPKLGIVARSELGAALADLAPPG
jgi:ATP/maltotriose-dependent transcriptional regulator MalT